MKIQHLLFSYLLMTTLQPGLLSAADTTGTGKENKSKNQILDFSVNDSPTYIQSDRLSLFSEKRLLKYTGQVKVLHDGMNMSCDELEAYYSENNEIVRLIAKFNVYITKGPEIKARSEKAVYEKSSETVTLTENPELQQEKSILAADLIRIFLNEDRSEAEGDVRVKLLEPEKEKGKDGEKKKKPTKERPGFKAF